jgi:hypothetical protein
MQRFARVAQQIVRDDQYHIAASDVRDAVRCRCVSYRLHGEPEAARASISVGNCEKCPTARSANKFFGREQRRLIRGLGARRTGAALSGGWNAEWTAAAARCCRAGDRRRCAARAGSADDCAAAFSGTNRRIATADFGKRQHCRKEHRCFAGTFAERNAIGSRVESSQLPCGSSRSRSRQRLDSRQQRREKSRSSLARISRLTLVFRPSGSFWYSLLRSDFRSIRSDSNRRNEPGSACRIPRCRRVSRPRLFPRLSLGLSFRGVDHAGPTASKPWFRDALR